MSKLWQRFCDKLQPHVFFLIAVQQMPDQPPAYVVHRVLKNKRNTQYLTSLNTWVTGAPSYPVLQVLKELHDPMTGEVELAGQRGEEARMYHEAAAAEAKIHRLRHRVPDWWQWGAVLIALGAQIGLTIGAAFIARGGG